MKCLLLTMFSTPHTELSNIFTNSCMVPYTTTHVKIKHSRNVYGRKPLKTGNGRCQKAKKLAIRRMYK